MEIVINIGVAFLNLIYCFHKLAPVRNRVSVISRQSAAPSPDVKLLLEEIGKEYPEIETQALYRMIPPGLFGKVKYLFHMMGPEMHALATSRVVILEGYCITASVLRHRRSLQILQMWHALGICKKFGYYVEGEAEGYSPKLIRALRMHRNYDAILASSEFCRPYYAKAFHYPEETVKVLPLPRVDLLRSSVFMEARGNRIRAAYPELGDGKKNILYAPTFRKGVDTAEAIRGLIDAADRTRFNLIVKLHPVERRKLDLEGVFRCSEYSSMELLSVADYVITDYSAFLFEAAVAGRPLFFYTWDLDVYLQRRGFCIDFPSEMPQELYREPEKVMKAIEEERWDPVKQKAFADRFVAGGTRNTNKLAQFVELLYNKSINV